MKNKAVIVVFTMLLAATSYASDSWCKVSTNSQNNTGYCTEGIDGKGKCLSLAIANAPRCSADQPEITFN